MSRDYKPLPQNEKDSESKGNPFITGLLVGFLIGLAVALAITLLIKKSGSPFTNNDTQAPIIQPTTEPLPAAPEQAKDSALPKDTNPTPPVPPPTAIPTPPPQATPSAKPTANTASPNESSATTTTNTTSATATTEPEKHFDFYTMLPNKDNTASDKETKPDVVKQDVYFLQVGSFQDQTEADNMKAKLALQGFEAVVQTANTPDKGLLHRVRVGPLGSNAQIRKVQDDLIGNGFTTTLIRVHTETPTQ